MGLFCFDKIWGRSLKSYFTLFALLITSGVFTQDKKETAGMMDFRIGGLFSQDRKLENKIDHFSVGFRLGGYLGKDLIAHRLNLNFALDYTPVSHNDFYSPRLGTCQGTRPFPVPVCGR